MDFPVEDFFEFIDRLQNEYKSVIIVEGVKDKEALKFWEITCPIEILSPPLLEFSEVIMVKYSKDYQIILLLDADPEGKNFHNFLKNEFRKFGFRVNSGYWIKIQKYKVTYIEGLNSSKFQELKMKYSQIKIEK